MLLNNIVSYPKTSKYFTLCRSTFPVSVAYTGSICDLAFLYMTPICLQSNYAVVLTEKLLFCAIIPALHFPSH